MRDIPEREIDDLRLELAHACGYVEALQAQVGARTSETEELREIALNLEQQLLERDEELERLRTTLREGDAWRRETEVEIRRLREELTAVKSTRLWRLGGRYWALRDSVRAVVRRRAA